MARPVILLAFADDDDAHLPLLEEESSMINYTLSPLHDRQILEVFREESTQIEELISSFQRFDGRLAIFHYGGHASGKGFRLNVDEFPLHPVSLRDFEMGRTEVSILQYRLYCDDTGKEMPQVPSWGAIGDNPMNRVSWWQALAYCNWLSEKQGLEPVYPEVSKWEKAQKVSAFLPNPANGYRLPTDAEWEYAAGGAKQGRDSTGMKYSLLAGSDSTEAIGWFLDNSGGRSQRVASKEPNQLGLYDMSGNVREWCWDWHGLYEGAAQENPLGPSTGTKKVVRGGDWGSKWRVLRISDRGDRPPDLKDTHIGFRVVRSAEASK